MIRIEEIESRLKAATPGPWQIVYNRIVDMIPCEGMNFDKVIVDVIAEDNFLGNLEFVSNAPTDISFLLNLVKKQREALEDIASDTCTMGMVDGSWKPNVPTYAARIAREALKEHLAEPNLCAENKGEG